MIEAMKFCGQDDRVRRFLLPERILYRAGKVSGEENLMIAKDIQVSTDEPSSIVMENGADGENAVILLDFGTEFSGGIRILTQLCMGNPTPECRLTFGESASEAMSNIGEKNATNDHSIRDMTIQLTQFSDMEFGQTGYRFARLELLSPNTTVRIMSILGVFVYRDIPYLGSFTCNDETLNQIYKTAAYTCHLNMQGMLWDGIKRDRLVWIGDMHPEALTIRTVFGQDKCIEEGLDYAARKFPLPSYSNHMVTYSMWWILIAHDWYHHNGSKQFLNDKKEYVTSLLKQLCGLVDDDGTDHLYQYDTGYFLDWPNFGKPESKSGVRALFTMALRAGATLCGNLYGDSVLQALCEKKADALSASVPADYSAKASAALMVLAGHLDPKTAAEEVLLPGGAKGFSTFMSYYQLSALAKADKMEDALDILKKYYGGMLSVGATTFWEDFDIDWIKEGSRIDKICADGEYDIHGDNGAHCYVGFRHSFCHGWSSAPTAFLAEYVLGIEILEPGCKKIRINPNLGQLSWAKGTYPTPYGILSVSCEKQEDGSLKVEYSAPEGITVIR